MPSTKFRTNPFNIDTKDEEQGDKDLKQNWNSFRYKYSYLGINVNDCA